MNSPVEGKACEEEGEEYEEEDPIGSQQNTVNVLWDVVPGRKVVEI